MSINYFHITHSQQQIIDEFCQIKNTNLQNIINNYIKEFPDINDKNKKANTIKLMKYIFNIRYPIYSKIKNSFEELIRKTKKTNISLNTHEIFEDTSVNININISNYNELIKSIEFLEQKKQYFKEYFKALENEDIL
ncbi:MAG: hypothetical protein M0R46_15525 [Candidatus Muirbacterium halophilum]|nr:hypothetical protein [Candidatus Muirbacterium halophilum]